MKILVTLPDNNYFLWQMLVQINNFKKLGFDENVIYLIGKRSMQKSSVLDRIMASGNIKSTFYVVNDERANPKYSPGLRPHILAKYYEKYPNAENETFLLLDPDVLFTKKIKLNDLEKDNVWYLSDTLSYINTKYIKSKGEQLFVDMCNIVGIDPQIVEANDDNAGGAQYLIKNASVDYWKKAESDSEKLYELMVTTSNKYCPEHPIQAWTAGMWADLWNAWLFGYQTKISKKMDFCWATDKIDKWGSTSIYHNAGAVIDNGQYFLKTKYQSSPFSKEINCSGDYCSYNYVKEIKETENNFKDILF